ncbi:DUF1709-domain-containing protein [Nadsonia fulvescens var. elongata DSM 6958]|uniref:DUF1709-domain-containing protein n=1 Tax=Nadsonia fulvescens var. elongata DSM 6958 TaxID=857566 RepID=A0A1E3PTD0_9ASCO|nr:DUF1709-domain-containing protein [Nadsonia fulvescens var. elongata DSM 6958]
MSRSRSQSPSKTDLLINTMTQASLDRVQDPAHSDFSFLPSSLPHQMRSLATTEKNRKSVAEFDFQNPAVKSDPPIASPTTPTAMTTPLGSSSSPQSAYRIDLLLPTEEAGGQDNDFSSSLYSTLQLGRNNTIISSTMNALSRKPSESGYIFQQLKHARSRRFNGPGTPKDLGTAANSFQNIASLRSSNTERGYTSKFDGVSLNSDSPREIDEETFNCVVAKEPGHKTPDQAAIVPAETETVMPEPVAPSHYPFDENVDFNAHINEPITSIPISYLNAISFTPPVSQGTFASRPESSLSQNADSLPSNINSPTSSMKSEEVEVDQLQSEISSAKTTTPVISSPQLQEVPPQPFKPDVDSLDRGRLFLKITSLRDLRLALPSLSSLRHDPHARFTLTLDNGIQCVTTSEIPLGPDAVIDQEFELVVGDDLEILLTLKAYMDPPVLEKTAESAIPDSSSTTKTSNDGGGRRSRSSSPKKKGFKLFGSSSSSSSSSAAAATQKARELEQIEKARLIRKQADIWHNTLGPKSEFARAYIMESQYEKEIYGKPQSFLLSCFNEWAKVEKEVVTSVTSRPTATGKPQKSSSSINGSNNKKEHKRYITEKRPPYRIGGLQVTMMYVPKSARKEVLPVSMEACVEALAAAKARREIEFSGYMSQEGDDCSYWRRRWFELKMGKLSAHHEESRKVRKVYDLSKAYKIELLSNINGDNKSLVDDQYIFIDGAFRICFRGSDSSKDSLSNNDYYDHFINFYADNEEIRNKWVQLLRMAMQYTPGKINNWTDLVLDNQKQELIKNQKAKGAWESWGKKSGFIECV